MYGKGILKCPKTGDGATIAADVGSVLTVIISIFSYYDGIFWNYFPKKCTIDASLEKYFLILRFLDAELRMLDKLDIKILDILQRDCTVSVAEIGKKVGLSTTPCWRRIQKMEELGVIRGRVALLDPEALNAPVTVFVFITTSQHSEGWLQQFHQAIERFPEVVEFYRMSGQVDYLLRVVVPDIAAYDAFYKKLIEAVDIADVSSSFAMEKIKFTTELPLNYAERSDLSTDAVP